MFAGFRRIAFHLGMSLATLSACQNKPTFENSAGESAAAKAQSDADRENWWNDQIQQKGVSSDEVAKDIKVKVVEEKIKSDPYIGCGYTAESADAAPIAPVTLKNVKSKIVSGFVTVTGSGSIAVSGRQNAMELSNLFTVLSTSPNNAEGRAVKLATKGSASTKFQNISQAEVQFALGAPADKPLCGFVMSKGLRSVSKDGVTYVQASFDKPIVTLINPMLSVERIKLQLIKPIKISGITATLESNDPEVNETGTVKRGDIEVSLIPTSRSVKDSLGQDIQISSEVAYRIANKFQGDGTNTTSSLLDQVADYYISGNKITHVVILSPLPELPVVVYRP